MNEVEVIPSSSDSDVSLGFGDVKDEIAAPYKKEVLKILQGAKTQNAEFVVSKELDRPPLLVLEVENVGLIHFPLYEEQAKKAIDKFKQSPFGKRTETVIDTSIRNSKQLDPREFKILNPNWEKYLQQDILKVIGEELSIHTSFKASLYKLLLYEPGSFFKPHRDSEKEDGMFGTLVIQLPSQYAGGELVVEHENKFRRLNFSSIGHPQAGREFKMFFAAFYCDCRHEILPVMEGYRMCLVYNLVSTKTNTVPVVPTFAVLEAQLVDTIRNWVKGKPSKIVYILSHKYTESAFSPSNLKGEDRSVVRLLENVSEICPLKVCFGLFEKLICGEAGGYPDNYNIINPEYNYSLTHVRCFNENIRFGKIKISLLNEVIPQNCFKGMDPDEQQFQEHSGNEGVSVDKFYRGASVIFWPEKYTPHFLEDDFISHGIITNLYLKAYDNYISNSGELSVVIEFLRVVLRRRPYMFPLSAECVKTVLTSVISLGQADMLGLLFENLDLDNLSDFTPILEQCDKYGWPTLGPSVVKMLEKCSSVIKISRLLSLLPEDNVTNLQKREVLLPCFKKCLSEQVKAGFVFRLHRAPSEMPTTKDKELHYRVLVIAKKLNYDITDLAEKEPLLITLVLLELTQVPGFQSHPVWGSTAAQCAMSLNMIVSEPMPPMSWSRKTPWACVCKDCLKLKEFLQSKRVQETFKLNKQRRKHLHQIMNGMTDLKHDSLHVGSPHVITVTKTPGAHDKKKADKELAVSLLSKLMHAMGADGSGSSSAAEYEVPPKVMKVQKRF